jgi:hypothetical protein
MEIEDLLISVENGKVNLSFLHNPNSACSALVQDTMVESTASSKLTKSKPKKKKTEIALSSLVKDLSPLAKMQIELLKKVFRRLDVDKDGFIGLDDLSSHFQANGIQQSQVQAKKWLRDKDVDQDGRLSLEEFVLEFLSKETSKVDVSRESFDSILGSLRVSFSREVTLTVCDTLLDLLSKVVHSQYPKAVTADLQRSSPTCEIEKLLYQFVGCHIENGSGNTLIVHFSNSLEPEKLEELRKALVNFMSFYVDPACADLRYGIISLYFYFYYFHFYFRFYAPQFLVP